MKIIILLIVSLFAVNIHAKTNATSEMILVEGGTFQMGQPDPNIAEDELRDDEQPVHSVTVDSFHIGKYEVTQAEYESVMGTNPSFLKGSNLPVETVTWYDAVEFCNKKSQKEGLNPYYNINKRYKDKNNKDSDSEDNIKWTVSTIKSANGYRLPTEAEWEFAALGGNSSKAYKYSGGNNINEVAWYTDNSNSKIHKVGTKKANELGIHDMSGNVREWCWDWSNSDYYSNSESDNPQGATSGTDRVSRGSDRYSYAEYCRVAFRGGSSSITAFDGLGFRLVKNIVSDIIVYEEKKNNLGTPTEEVVLKESTEQIDSNTTSSAPNNMVYVEGGTFQMGLPMSEIGGGGHNDAEPIHSVTVNSFYIGKHEVTQAEYESIEKINPSKFKGSNLPVEEVSWYAAVEFCNKKSKKDGLTPYYNIDKYREDNNNDNKGQKDWKKWTIKTNLNSDGYRLPTEAEWEFAAKGGNSSKGYKYSGGNSIGEVAWYKENSNNNNHKVGTKKPNELGIHDMSGNVFEWCWDWYKGGYDNKKIVNPKGASNSTQRVHRGGSRINNELDCSSAFRFCSPPVFKYNTIGFRLVKNIPIKKQPIAANMVLVEGGTFPMGQAAPEGGSGHPSDEDPVRSVTVNSFSIGKYEVTQGEFNAVMGYNPSYNKGTNLPVELVSWYDAIEFCNKKSKKDGLTAYYNIDKSETGNKKNREYNKTWKIKIDTSSNGYRLPTEAEWEFAARGGTNSNGHKYSGGNSIDDVAWYHKNAGDSIIYAIFDHYKVISNNNKTHKVGTKEANELGIHDMSGNVSEWCWDLYDKNYYRGGEVNNPKGADNGPSRVIRGGSWYDIDSFCRTAKRHSYNPSYTYNTHGFRLVKNIPK